MSTIPRSSSRTNRSVRSSAGKRRPRVPWNPTKSFIGTTAALVVGISVAWLMLRYDGAVNPWGPALAAGLAAAFAESLPWPIDDNLPVAAAAAAALLAGGVS